MSQDDRLRRQTSEQPKTTRRILMATVAVQPPSGRYRAQGAKKARPHETVDGMRPRTLAPRSTREVR
jgi:hypothetical protein